MVHPDYVKIGDPEDRIVEEIGEILKALGKGKRFGWENYHPDDKDKQTNFQKLHYEILDLLYAYDDLRVKLGKEVLYTKKFRRLFFEKHV